MRTPSSSSSSSSSSAHTILTAAALRRDHPALVAALEEAGASFSWVTQWAHLLHAEDLPASTIVLVDLDAANHAAADALAVPSGYRLTKLLARASRATSALVVLTYLDYVEIEDLVQAGVRALVDPRLGAGECAARILATAAPRTPRRLERIPVAVGSLVDAPGSNTPRSHPLA